jgi:hypothetical protein
MRGLGWFLGIIALAAADSPVIEIVGKIVPNTSLQFKTDACTVYDLIRNNHSTALFLDTNLHSRILQLKGREQPGGKFEISGNLHSVKDGKVYELFYYCSICVIETSVSGPCLCCREEMVLTERIKTQR